MTTPSVQQALSDHLAQWGLRRFSTDEAYARWQRQELSPDELSALHQHVERKRHGSSADETAFYDLTAAPRVLPVLYSQRYEYYVAIATVVDAHLGEARTILDFGCGPGILTTFYARRFPHAEVTGVDRSATCIAQANRKADELGLKNVRFVCADLVEGPAIAQYERVVATHALVQSEQDPGLPSFSWRTFERALDVQAQAAFEDRTGLGCRLDRLAAAMVPAGRLVVFEKTRQLSRRIPLQRAFAARGLKPFEQPRPIRYSLVEEVSDDGPLFVLARSEESAGAWNEDPEPDEGLPFDRVGLTSRSSSPEEPLYENHWPSAQQAWEQLDDKKVIKEATAEESGGRQLHVELGTAEGFRYLYCANTFDRRQLVIVEPAQAAMLHTYYQEIIQGSA
ncbi:MAG TPA: methyltransferase domain-containing protein [Nitrospira sp.]|nr:methyltransferase domain-containing protein [Nitrospira sp.]